MSDDIGDSNSGVQGQRSGQPAPGRRPGENPPPLPHVAGRADRNGTATRPLSPEELKGSLVRPDLLAAQVLGSADRIALNLSGGEGLGLLIVLLSGASLVATAPYGAFSPVESWWKVAALFTGSLLICFPSLHVFLQFLGVKISLARNLALSLVITATAGLFTLGFSPIIWFIDRTTRATDSSVVTPSDLSRLLLAVSLLMGVVQMGRCLAASRCGADDRSSMTAPIFVWIALYFFIVWRMAGVLGIRG
jgi:hypothetical protein